MRTLLAIALVCFLLGCAASDAQPKALAPPDRLPREAIGRGENVDSAKKAAVGMALKELNDAMSLQYFVLSEDYLREHVLAGPGKAGKDIEMKINEEMHTFKAWVLTFKPQSEWWSDISRRDLAEQRKVRAAERQTVTSRIMVGVAFVLLAGFGYVRLDEYTQRRYTTLLRLAGVSFAGVAIGSIWWAVS